MISNDRKINIFWLATICIYFKTIIELFPQGLWLQTNINYQYRSNDFYIQDLKNYNIIEFGLRTGISPIKINSNLVVQVYADGNLNHDVSKNKWNYVDWHNNLVFSIGSQIRLHSNELLFISPREFNIELFAEKTWISYFRDTSFYTGHRPKDDLKFGLRYSFISNEYSIINSNENSHNIVYSWFDSFGGLYYAKTSFYNISQNNFYLIDINCRAGLGIYFIKIFPVEFYLVQYSIYDLGNNEWNKLFWNNRFRFGGGVRLNYLRFPLFRMGEINIAISPFVEYLSILYSKKVPYVPSYCPKNDIYAGIKLGFSISQKEE